MKLYWGPHTCAIGIHILLEELGARYDTIEIDVAGGATREPDFLALNPKGKVPVLVRDDGSVLTEFSAIASWLALTHPDSRLLPLEAGAAARAIEMLAYIEGTVHAQGFARIFAPRGFLPDAAQAPPGVDLLAEIRQRGVEIVGAGFAILNSQLASGQFAVGDKLTIADAALFYVERWADANAIALPPRLQAHLTMMRQRPAVQRVMRQWREAG